MSAAIDKIRTKLFHKFTASDYGLDLSSEVILEGSEYYKTVGGLGYTLTHPEFTRVEIKHEGRRDFTIFLFGPVNMGTKAHEIPRHAIQCEFKDLDQRLMKALKG